MAVLDQIGNEIKAAAERFGPSVVGLGRGWGFGSGVVLEQGRVLTAAHNIRRDEVTVALADGRRETGRVAGVDPDLDIAVIEVDTGVAPPIEWADVEPDLGTPVIALANPGGRGLRASFGFVSSAGRSFRGPRGRRIRGVIEHNAPLPRGSSGGPLLDTSGGLLGLNAVRVDGGLILAVPADQLLRDRAAALSRGETTGTPRLGVAVASPRAARRMRQAVGLPERDGLLVRAVEEGSPADRAGIERGDLIVGAAGDPVEGIDSLHAALDRAAGGKLGLSVVRGAEEQDLEVDLGVAA
ncbi:MAG: S1C family serine protease [Thermoleophilaceae bacterium]